MVNAPPESIPVGTFGKDRHQPSKESLLKTALEVVARAGDVVVATRPIAAGRTAILKPRPADFRFLTTRFVEMCGASLQDFRLVFRRDKAGHLRAQRLEEGGAVAMKAM